MKIIKVLSWLCINSRFLHITILSLICNSDVSESRILPFIYDSLKIFPGLVLSLHKSFQRPHELVGQRSGDGPMCVCRGLHVLGDEVPSVRDSSTGQVFGGPEQFGRQLLQASSITGLEFGPFGQSLN